MDNNIGVPQVESYLDELCDRIRKLGASPSFVQEARENVSTQVYSFLAHWKDTAFRNTLMFIGKEEGRFYKPTSPINPFVVVTIRNSILERLHSVSHSQTGLSKGISPTEIKQLTQHAIRHFSRLDFDALCELTAVPEDMDCYGHLPAKYCVAWAALCQLAGSGETEIFYDEVVQKPESDIESWVTNEAGHGKTSERKAVVLDGFSKTIDPMLQEYLRGIRDGELQCMYFDALKRLTRNTEKLLFVMNYVLISGGAFVTANYFVTNGYIEQRSVYLPPSENSADSASPRRIRQLLNCDVGEVHQRVLRSMLP